MNLKRVGKKPVETAKDLTTSTKIIFGNGKAMATRFQDRLHRFLVDLRELDNAVWKVIDDTENRINKAIELFVSSGKGKETNLDAVKNSWTSMVGSAVALGKDVRLVARTVKRRTQRTMNGA